MKLEENEDTEQEEVSFCGSCGKQLFTIDEITQRICHHCKNNKDQKDDEKTFFCWACGEKLVEMGEVAQGLCHNCKAYIIRKINTPSKKTDASDNR